MADMDAGRVTLEIRAVSDKLTADVNAAKAKITPALQSIEKTAKIDMSSLAGGLNNISSTMPVLATGAAAAAGAVDGLKAAMIALEASAPELLALALALAAVVKSMQSLGDAKDVAAERQSLETAYGAILKDKDATDSLMKSMQDLANTTDLTMDHIANGGRILLAMGFDANEVVPMIRDLGDAAVASGKGAEGMERLALILGQIKNKGRLQGDELLQLSEAGINPMKELGDAVGKTGAELQKMISDGKVSADVAIKAIRDGIRKDFGGAMEEASKTYKGRVSNMEDAWTNLKITMGKPFLNPMGDMLASLASALTTIESKVKKIQEAFSMAWDMQKHAWGIPDIYEPPSRKLPTPESPAIFKQWEAEEKARKAEADRAKKALPVNLEALKLGEKLAAEFAKDRIKKEQEQLDKSRAIANEAISIARDQANAQATAVVDGLKKQFDAHQDYINKVKAIYDRFVSSSAAVRSRMTGITVENVGKAKAPDFEAMRSSIERGLVVQQLGAGFVNRYEQATQFGGSTLGKEDNPVGIIRELKQTNSLLFKLLWQQETTRQQAVLS